MIALAYGGKLNRSARTVSYVTTIDGLEEAQPEYDTVNGAPSTVGVCPCCGVAWARVTNYYLCPYTNEPKSSQFRAVSSLCPEHGGGSLFEVWPTSVSPHYHFGKNAMLREYDLLLSQVQRK